MEIIYSHQLKGQSALPAEEAVDAYGTSTVPVDNRRLDQLEQRVADLEDLVAGLRDAFRDFKTQFE